MIKNYRPVGIVILLVVLFIAPALLAWFLYHNTSWLGGAQTNKGELLSPPVKLDHIGLQQPKWHLVLWSPQACEGPCLQQLDQIARVRLALGRRLYEVQLELLLGAGAPELPEDWAKKLHEHDVHVLKLNTLEQQSKLPSNSELLILDPAHYWVLSYPVMAQPKDILHDLKRLLNVKEQ